MLVLYPYLKAGAHIVSPFVDPLLIRLFFYLSLLALLYSTINLFREYFNRTGWLLRILNRNAYGVYVLHLIVLGLIAMFFMDVDLGSKSKYLLLIISTFALCNILVYLYQVVKTKWLAVK